MLGRERLVRSWWRHHLVRIFRDDPLPDFAGGRIARLDGHGSIVCGQRSFRLVEPQFSLALLGVGAVAGEAVFRQDRADIAIEAELRGSVPAVLRVAATNSRTTEAMIVSNRCTPKTPGRTTNDRPGGQSTAKKQAGAVLEYLAGRTLFHQTRVRGRCQDSARQVVAD